MKICLGLLIPFLFNLSARSDIGNMAYLEMELTFQTGKQQTVYTHIPEYAYQQDSLSHSSYVKRMLLSWSGFQDTIHLFKDAQFFTFSPYWDSSQTIKAMNISMPIQLLATEIESVQVKNVHLQSAAIGFLSLYRGKNQSWMHREPIGFDTAFSFSCDFMIYNFDKDPSAQSFIDTFKSKCHAVDDFDPQAELFTFLSKARSRKIIIVQICTC